MKRLLVYITVVFTIAVSGLAWGVYHSQASPPTTVQTPVVQPATIDSLLSAVNAERAKVGVAPLKLYPLLNESAQYKADDMWTRNYRAHEDPDTGKKNGIDYFYAKNLNLCSYVSENLVWDNHNDVTSAQQAIEWWLRSPAHKKAMLDPQYTYTGFGIAGGSVVVEHFCTVK